MKNLLTFNINGYMYIQITEKGFEHLQNTVGDEYIKNCIENRKIDVGGETWYKLQCWDVFDLFPCGNGFDLLFKTNVMFDCDSMEGSKFELSEEEQIAIDFYKKITDWLLPKGYVAIYKNHPCSKEREWHFMKDGIRVCCVCSSPFGYWYAVKEILNQKYFLCLETGRFEIGDNRLYDIHMFMKNQTLTYSHV